MKHIDIKRDRAVIFQISEDIFVRLFEHTTVRRRVPYVNSLSAGVMSYNDFIELTRAAEVPYPLFLAPEAYVESQIKEFERQVFYGVSKTQLALATRGDVELADISLILKDLTRKQGVLRKHTTDKNTYPGMYKKSAKSNVAKANELRKLLGYDLNQIAKQSKEASFNYLRSLLAAQNIYVSLYMHNFCPQVIPATLKFSGICIKDSKCPFIFIRASDENSAIESWGRRIFTMALLLACMCNGKFGAVSMNSRAKDIISDDQYELTEEFLMPEALLIKCTIAQLSDIEDLASRFSVSPTAMTMRLHRLGVINQDEKNTYLDTLTDAFDKIISQKGGGNQPILEKAIAQYNSPKTVRIITDLVNSGSLAERDARNLLYYRKGDSFNLEALSKYGS